MSVDALTPHWRRIYLIVVVAALVIMIALYWFTETFNIPLAGS